MDVDLIIKKYYQPYTKGYDIYIQHVTAVAKTALSVCENNPELNINKELVYNAAMLHDIGICMVDAASIECYGFCPYIQHGILGRLILEDEGFADYGRFCETHVGTGFYKDEIIDRKLPLPIKDMIPNTIEEQVVCYADKFFSKSDADLSVPKNLERVKHSIAKYGQRGAAVFENWLNMFGFDYIYDK
ncbi:MAG: HDIG domain-containing protein [Bacteroidales bacterium]|jgi:uncharacterized protein|nr:HDIG domain-containing protein [Bacteroidales bacterium]